MTKKMKKLTAMLLAGMLVTQGTMSVNATELNTSKTINQSVTNTEESYIIQLLEEVKVPFGLDYVDFAQVYVGEPIDTYEYVDTGVNNVGSLYPIIYDQAIIAVAQNVGDENWQIDSGILVNELNEQLGKAGAVIYDNDTAYFYDGSILETMYECQIHYESRESLNEDATPLLSAANALKYQLSNVLEVELTSLQYVSTSRTSVNRAPRESTYIGLDVELVTQSENQICWAASMACMADYVANRSYTDVEIAQLVTGEEELEGYNVMKEFYELSPYFDDVGLWQYSLNCTEKFTYEDVLANINRYRPLMARFLVTPNNSQVNPWSHAVVVYGALSSVENIMIMDPAGYMTLIDRTGNDYTYIRDGKTFTQGYDTFYYV